ncbi:DUF429 domain-containing protein [Staphylococcus felis]|uniref:DUF429 domain-containing protein n=1 Tax=Staphylococcus felis TaxID=46127 RepID=UPI0039672DD2
MYYIGIDLAWTDQHEAGLCVINKHGLIQYIHADIWTDEALLEILKRYEGPLRIAIDAPLIVPNNQGSRQAERILAQNRIHQHHVRAFHVSRTFLTKTYGVIRGENLLSLLQNRILNEVDIHINETSHYVVETFPTAITASLFPNEYPFHYKQKRNVNFQQSLQGLKRLDICFKSLEREGHLLNYKEWISPDWHTMTRQSKKHIEDQLDALLCAYSLYLIHQDNQYSKRIFGQAETGAIVIPYSNL